MNSKGAVSRLFSMIATGCLLLAAAPDASAQVLTNAQVTCVNTQNKSGSKVEKTQGKENFKCVKDATKNKLVGVTAEECLTADRKDKVMKATDKAIELQGKKCIGPDAPFGFQDSAVINQVAVDEELGIAADIFGNLDTPPGIFDATDTLEKVQALCQSDVANKAEKLSKTIVKEFTKCKKLAFKDIQVFSITDLENCVGTDPKTKIGKAETKLMESIEEKKCPTVDFTNTFPNGVCGTSATPADFTTCVTERVRCHSCQLLNGIDGMNADCDTYDNGVVDGSCAHCGNGFTDAGEDCDDGNASNNDACLNDCTAATCGDGFDCTDGTCTTGPSGGAEECDDGNASQNDNCLNDCSTATCGDGEVCSDGACTTGPGSGPEECDDANADNTDACIDYCGDAVCGDGFTWAGMEDCDDAGESATCDDDCTTAICPDGNTNVTAGESCDDGNFSDTDPCLSDCTDADCGDGNVCSDGACTTGPGGGVEECDDANADNTDMCIDNCADAVCGDGFIEAGAEDCDDSGESATCDADCTTVTCGDGTTNATAGEDCDDAGESATCDADCTDAICGDTNVNATAGETCDEGGETATCDDDCTAPSCGDGNLNTAAGETCDDGGESATCDTDCTPATCGDGTTNATAGEDCDDSGESATCDADCTTATCGDGTTNVTAGETCDDAGESATCDTDCTAASCGDGTTNATAGEDCDDAGESASCDADCTDALCGDGTINTTAGETCDDSGESATCDIDCTAVACGDGVVNMTAGEECDPPGVGCSGICEKEQDPSCPDSGILQLWSGTGVECTTNADCVADGSPGDCDTGIGRCTTESDLDTGFTGIGHDADISEDVFVAGDLFCPGPAPTCGQCDVEGVNPSVGNCRCAGDNRSVCDEPFVADADDCGGGICNCYFGTLLSLSAGNVPVCVVNRFREDITGTANVDTGDGVITAALRSEVYTGEKNVKPCPVCGSTCTAPTDGRCTSPFVNKGNTCNLNSDCDSSPGNGVCQFSFGDTCAQDQDCDINSADGVGSCGGSAICTAPAVNEGDPCSAHVDCDDAGGDGVCGTFDATAGDGVRGGSCHLGRDDGSSCDIDGVSRIFPAGNGFGGGGYSLDCFPEVGRNVSGSGLVIDLVQTTGVATMDANVDCGAIDASLTGEDCFCAVCSRVCSLDDSVTCSANVDCQRCSLDPSGPVCGTGANCRRCSAASSNPGASCFVNGQCPGGCCETQEPGPPADTCAGTGAGVCDNSALGTCLGDSNVPCNSDSDCSVVAAASTCTSTGDGEIPFPNKCDANGTGGNGTVGLCTDSGGGEGECADVDDQLFSCDGVTRPNGEGFISCDPTTKCDDLLATQCVDNNDCAMGIECVSDLECREASTGIPGGAGDCTLAKRRSCFVDPIVGTGLADANEPLGVATFCIPPTAAGPAINKVAGLPGPGRVRTKATTTIVCAGAPHGCANNADCDATFGNCQAGTCLYTPGDGGCP